jgi:hypothetical protein
MPRAHVSRALKSIIVKNPKVNAALLAESLKVSIQLAKAGVTIRKGYNLPSAFEKRLVKTSVSELLLSFQEEK